MSKKQKKQRKQWKRLAVFTGWVEHWRDRLSIEDFDVYVEPASFDPGGTLADISRDTDSRSALVKLYEHPPQLDVDLSDLAKHELIHLLLSDLSALAHTREATHAQIERAEEALVVRLCRLIG